jgi:hypothetical protein
MGSTKNGVTENQKDILTILHKEDQAHHLHWSEVKDQTIDPSHPSTN